MNFICMRKTHPKNQEKTLEVTKSKPFSKHITSRYIFSFLYIIEENYFINKLHLQEKNPS